MIKKYKFNKENKEYKICYDKIIFYKIKIQVEKIIIIILNSQIGHLLKALILIDSLIRISLICVIFLLFS